MIYFKSSSSIQNALPTLSLILISVVRFILPLIMSRLLLMHWKFKVSVQVIYDDLLLENFVNENDKISNIEINSSKGKIRILFK